MPTFYMTNSKIDEAKRILKIADHMAYITYPVLKEHRLLIKILEQISKALTNSVSAILIHEYSQKRIKTYTDPKLNFDTFKDISTSYGLNEGHIKTIKNVSNLMESHNRSTMEFIRKDKFVIMSDNLQTQDITLDQVKSFLKLSKEIIDKAEKRFSKDSDLA